MHDFAAQHRLGLGRPRGAEHLEFLFRACAAAPPASAPRRRRRERSPPTHRVGVQGPSPWQGPGAAPLAGSGAAPRHSRHQQIRGNCSPASQSTMRPPPKPVVICTNRSASSITSPIRAASRAERMGAHGRQQRRGGLRRDDGHQLAFVGDVQRVEAEQFAGRGDLRAHRDRRFRQQEPTPDCWAISFSVAASPPRVGSRISRRPAAGARHHGRDQPVQRRRVGQDRGVERQVLAQRHDGDAMVADRAGQQHHIARPRAVAGQDQPGRHDADAGGGDEHAVGLAALDHLGVAGDDRHPGLAARPRPCWRRCGRDRRAETLPRG